MRSLKMTTGLSGPEICLAPGDEHDFEDDEAERLVDAGFAIDIGQGAPPLSTPPIDAGAAAEADAKAKADADAAAEADVKAKADAAAEAGVKAKADADAAAAAAVPVFANLSAARAAYKATFGKGTSPAWSVEQIAAKIAEKSAQG